MKKYTLFFIVIIGLTACGGEQEKTASVRLSAPLEVKCTTPHAAELNSGNTTRMRSAMVNINTCLEEAIKDASTTRLGGEKSQLVIEQSLELLSTGYQRIMWEIAIEDVSCRPTCGSISQLTHVSAYNSLLIDILDNILAIQP